MILRTEAYLSEDRRYRYWLLRVWDETLPLLCVIGLNPSTADEKTDDPTIRKTIGFARQWGYGGVLMLNVGAFRATQPAQWKAAMDPFGPENSIDCLREYIGRFKPKTVIAAWGNNCGRNRAAHRVAAIVKGITGMMCWGRNTNYTPRHPLMLPYSTPLEAFN